jgi:hypothetical protein
MPLLEFFGGIFLKIKAVFFLFCLSIFACILEIHVPRMLSHHA